MKRIAQSKILCFLVISIVIVVLPTEILARTDKWRRQNDRGNRYEGRIDIPAASPPPLELFSFAGFHEAFAGDVTLTVRFFLPSISPVFIHGRELREQKQYRMESKPADWQAGAWNDFGPWPTGKVLSREGIPWSNLGVVIRFHTETTNGGQLAPAFIYHSKPPESVAMYTLYLRPNWTLKMVTYSLYRIINDQEVHVKTWSLHGAKTAGEPFPLKLDVSGLLEGPMLLVVTGAYKNRIGGPIEEYRFYHKPQIANRPDEGEQDG